MVSVVTVSGLGVFNSSKDVLGSPQELAIGAGAGAVIGKVLPAVTGVLNRVPVLGDTLPQLGKRISAALVQGMENVATPRTLNSQFGGLRIGSAGAPTQANATRIAELQLQGHALERHGGAMSDADLIKRAYTGVAPDGSALPRGRTPDSTAFFSDSHLVQADDFLRQSALPNAVANAAPGQLRLGVSADMGVPVGRGYLPVGKVTGLDGPLLRVDNITNVQGWYRYNPATGTWETTTIFPLARP